MRKRQKIIVGSVVAALVVGAGVVGGTLWYRAHAQEQLNARYGETLAALVDEAEVLAVNTHSLVALGEVLDPDGTSPEIDLKVSETAEAALGILDQVTGLDAVTVNEGAPRLVTSEPILEAITASTDTDTTQSGAQSGAQSGVQSGGAAGLSVAEMVLELPGLTAEEPAENAQSGEAAQSGEPQSPETILAVNDADTGNHTQDEITGLEALTVEVRDQGAAVVKTGEEVIGIAHADAVKTATTGLDAAAKALAERIAAAQKLLDESKDKVADGAVRDALQKAIEAAKKVADSKPASPGSVVSLKELTVKKDEAAKGLDAPMKAVSDSVAAKKKADEEAAAAAEAAEAARLAEEAARQYVQPDYGYNDYGYNGGGNSGGGGGEYTPPPANSGGGGGSDRPSWDYIPPAPGGSDPNFCAPPANCAV